MLCVNLYSLLIFTLTETRIKDQPLANIILPGNSFAHVNSQSSVGGVAIYISNNLNFKLCKNQHHLHNSEAIWLDISDQKNKYIVGVHWRQFWGGQGVVPPWF